MSVKVVHVLWECPVCSDIREAFIAKLSQILGQTFDEFDVLCRL